MKSTGSPSRRSRLWIWGLAGLALLVVILVGLRVGFVTFRQQQIISYLRRRGFDVRTTSVLGDWPRRSLWIDSSFMCQRVRVSTRLMPCTDADLAAMVELSRLIFDGMFSTARCEFRLLHSEITDHGLKNLRNARHIDELDVNSSLITNSGLRHFATLKEIRSLGFESPEVSDAGLMHLKGLENLTRLDLNRNRLTGEGLAWLSGLQKLEQLNLDGTLVTDAGLAHLETLVNLKMLDLDQSQISDSGLSRLLQMKELEFLSLNGTAITDAGLTQLAKLTSLRNLQLQQTSVTDAGLRQIKTLDKLQFLNLRGTRITDAGLAEMKGFPEMANFGVLNVVGTEVSARGKSELQKSLPHTLIEGP